MLTKDEVTKAANTPSGNSGYFMACQTALVFMEMSERLRETIAGANHGCNELREL